VLRGRSPLARRANSTGSSLVKNQNTIAINAMPVAQTCAVACQP
jgi:hypothetical protein